MEQARPIPEQVQNGAWKNGALQAVMKIILNPTETQRNYKSFLNSFKRYKAFEEGLESESGRVVELLMSGSMAERLFAQHWIYRNGRREATNDIDLMLVDCSMAVVEKRGSECSESLVKAFEAIPGRENQCSTEVLPHTCDIKAKCNTQVCVQPLNTETPETASLQNHSTGKCSDPVALHKSTQKQLFLEATNHPSYVQLYELDVEGKPAFLTTESFKGFWSGIVNKTALYSLITSGPQLPSGGVVVSGPALNRRDRPSRRNNYAHDYVPCLHCPKWPTMADKWHERRRTVEWPSKGLISDIISKGCHVVPVSHHDNDNEPYHTEWRLSFSSAEKRLVHSLTTEQRQSYIVAKLIMKQVIQELKDSASGPLLENTPSSYHLKTILLWKCEEKQSEEWKNLLNSVVELLKTFVDYMRRGNIPNYFIPENNMIGHIKHQDLISVANGIAASLNDLSTILHHVFLAAYGTVLDYDSNTGPVLRLVDKQLKIFAQTGIAGDKLFLYYILNSLVDSLSAAITGTCDELKSLEDHKHILNIYCSHHSAVGSPVILPPPPVSGAAESDTTVMALFQYLHTLLQEDHILSLLQTDVFAFLSRTFTQTLPSLTLREQLSHDCCEASLNVFQNVCHKLGLAHNSDLSCHDELSTLAGVDYIFSVSSSFAELEAFEFVVQRFQKFKKDGQLEKVKSLQW